MKETEEDDEEVYPEYQDLDREMSDSPHQLPVQTQEPPSSFDDLEEEEPYPEYELAAGESAYFSTTTDIARFPSCPEVQSWPWTL